jgi:hypothetical protein
VLKIVAGIEGIMVTAIDFVCALGSLIGKYIFNRLEDDRAIYGAVTSAESTEEGTLEDCVP